MFKRIKTRGNGDVVNPYKRVKPDLELDGMEDVPKIKCPECGISVPDVPEDATYEEMLCNGCYELQDVV